MQRTQKTGTMATLSIIAAIVAFILIFTGSPIWGLILSLLSIPLGILGLIIAASPRVSGSVMSIFGILLGGLGVVIAILGTVGVIIF